MIGLLGHLGTPVKYYTRVLGHALESALWFVVIFVAVFLGFALSANVLFGEQIREYSSVSQAMIAMGKWWITLTDPPTAMFKHIGGTAFFILFVAILMILLFNMFVMIVISSAEAVKHE